MERKLNKNALRSKALIREAFYKLLTIKPYVTITVTDIVREADINRATFYAHYSCIADLLQEINNEIIEKLKEILSKFSLDRFCDNPTSLLFEVSKFIDDNIDKYKILLEKTYSNDFMDYVTNLFVEYISNDLSIPESIKKDRAFPLRVYYAAGGISTLYLNWLKGNLNCSIYDVAIEIAKIIMENSILPSEK